MNHWKHRLFVFCISTILLLAGCQPKEQGQNFLPVTGADESPLPARVALAQESVLDYVLSSSRIMGLPQNVEWQMEARDAADQEFRFHSGDWLMVILPDDEDGNQKVILFNKADHTSWTGYVDADGRVVDTAYYR